MLRRRDRSRGIIVNDTSLSRGDPRRFRACGLVLWLRGDMGITLNGSDVSAWADQSGVGNDVSQGTAALQPAYTAAAATLNNKPTLTFTIAAGDLLVNAGASLVPTSSARSTFAAFDTNGTGGVVIEQIASVTTRAMHIWAQLAGTYYIFTDGVAVNETIPDPGTFISPHCGAWLQPAPGALISFYLDGAEQSVAGGNIAAETAGTGFTVGNRQNGGSLPLDGALAELVVYSTSVNASTRIRVQRYQRARYGT